MNLKLISLAAVLLLLALAGAYLVSGSRSFQLFGQVVDRVHTTSPVVALTFDDGPTQEGTDSILSILAEEGVKATFFLTGQELATNVDLGRRFVAAGHELANHSFSHQRFLLKSQTFIRREIESTDSLIREAGHAGTIYFRPPYGKKLVGLPWYLSRTGRTTVMANIEPDSHPEIAEDSERMVEYVLSEVTPGSIILLHVMYPSRIESLRSVRGIIEGLRSEGYSFVRVSELLGDGR